MEKILVGNVNITHLVTEIEAGKTIVYPTETCYGLGGDATNPAVVKKIYALKGRPEGKPFILLVPSLEIMTPYIQVTPLLQDIAKKYWPGPLTVVTAYTGPDAAVVSGVPGLPRGVVSQEGTIAFRISSHSFAKTLTAALGRPLISTSANLAGEPNVYEADVVTTIFADRPFQPDIIVDAGAIPLNPPSTIVKLDGDTMTVIRQGNTVLSR